MTLHWALAIPLMLGPDKNWGSLRNYPIKEFFQTHKIPIWYLPQRQDPQKSVKSIYDIARTQLTSNFLAQSNCFIIKTTGEASGNDFGISASSIYSNFYNSCKEFSGQSNVVTSFNQVFFPTFELVNGVHVFEQPKIVGQVHGNTNQGKELNNGCLPSGWHKRVTSRKSGKQRGRLRGCILSPCGGKFTTKAKLKRYLKEKNLDYQPEVLNTSTKTSCRYLVDKKWDK